MKKILLLSVIILFSSITYSQSPYSFNYQGLARNAEGEALRSQEISLRIGIVSNSPSGNLLYQEVHDVVTSEFGVFSLQIGEGQIITGDIMDIDWGGSTMFIKTEIDPSGGSNFIDLGTSQMHSVPYALFAAETGGSSDDADADPENELQSLSFSGSQLSLSQGNTVDVSSLIDDADADPNNEIQSLEVNSTFLAISGSNGVDLSFLIDDEDANPINEIQALGLSNTFLGLSGSNAVDLSFLIDDADADPQNEIQSLQLNNSSLSLSSSNAVDLSSLIDDADADPQNEIQSLSIDGNTLSLSGGNSVDLPEGQSPWSESPGGISYDGPTILFAEGNAPSILFSKFSNGGGAVDVYGESSAKVELLTTVDDAGLGRFYGGNNNLNVLISSIATDANKAWIGHYDELGGLKGASFVAASGRGGAFYHGPNGNSNIDLTAVGSNINHGFLSIKDENGDTQAGIYVDDAGNGRVFADFVDTFVDNPTKSSGQVRYSMIQGPEAAAYLRGTAMLIDGKAGVNFPAHFEALIEEGTMTVMITPLSSKSKGIAVVKKGKQGFHVEELLEGAGNYQFDWEVKAERYRERSLKALEPQGIPTADASPHSSNRKN